MGEFNEIEESKQREFSAYYEVENDSDEEYDNIEIVNNGQNLVINNQLVDTVDEQPTNLHNDIFCIDESPD